MVRAQRDIDALLVRIRSLVRAREHRRRAGAGDGELDLEIARLHTRLAERVRRGLQEEATRHGARA